MSEQREYLRTHRFAVDELSSPILHEQQEVFNDLQKQFPNLRGIAFFGSRTKGTAHNTSDLDLVLFYDGSNKTPGIPSPGIAEASQRFQQSLGPLRNLDFSRVDISQEATDEDINIFARLTEPTGTTSWPRSRFNLISRFCLGIGDGLYTNRAYILNILETMENGETIFRSIMEELRKHERTSIDRPMPFDDPFYDVERPADIRYEGQYPQTIEQARKRFITAPQQENREKKTKKNNP